MASSIDIEDILKRSSITIEAMESDAETKARLIQESREHRARIIKGYVIFFVVLAALIAVGLLCGYEELLDANATAETKKWAQTTLTGLLTGSISFLVGQAVGKTPK